MWPAIARLVVLMLVMTVSACKLAVIVVEGGEVQSSASGTCLTADVCTVPIDSTDFSETFRASPAAGWYFHKWSAGDRFLCGGSADPQCQLSFEGLENNPLVEAVVASTEVFFLMPVFKETPPVVKVPADTAVNIGGKQWLQPSHFTGYSYEELLTVCPSGVCSGRLVGSDIDLTGYTWASSEEIRALFQLYEPSRRYVLGDFIYTQAETDDVLAQIVNLTISGLLRDTPTDEGWVYSAGVFDGQPFEPSPEEFQIGANPFGSTSQGNDEVGAWFWKATESR